MSTIFSNLFSKKTTSKPSILINDTDDVFEKYKKLEALYLNNGAYNDIQRLAYQTGEWLEAIKAIKTPVNRSVEFYVTNILAGAEVSSKNASVLDAINQFIKWSNFDAKQKTFSRSLALYGDLFVKVTTDDAYSKVYQEEISAKNVTSFELDSRGFLTELRIDIEIDDGVTYTEYWVNRKGEDGYVSIWEHKRGKGADLEELGTPKDFIYLTEMGIDFIPIVYIKFIDFGGRGQGCVSHALDKIDEANRQSTRLNQMLFRYNKPLWAVMANGVDAQGRPLPAPRLANSKTDKDSKKTDDMEVGDNSIVYLPGMSKMESLIPNIQYGDALNILKDMMNEIELDLPELKSYSLDVNQLSTKSIQLVLGAAIAKAKTARENIIQGLIRINQMALTIGKFYGIFPATIGDYANGDFEHEIICDEIYGNDSLDKAELIKAFTDAGLPLSFAMKQAGYSQEEIDAAISDKQSDDLRKQSNLVNSIMKDTLKK